MTTTLTPGSAFPDLSWPAVGGGKLEPMRDGGWRLLVIYRGKHCPLCRNYLGTLNGMLSQYQDADVRVYAVSADPIEKAELEAAEEGWRFPVGYDLKVEDMRQLGLFVSTPKSPEETDRLFAEPASFLIDDKGRTFMIEVSNSAIARPELGMLLEGLKFVRDEHYPVRGTA